MNLRSRAIRSPYTVPLNLAKGAGSETRQALGTVVFYGMLGVTFFGLFFTPVFYYVIRSLTGGNR